MIATTFDNTSAALGSLAELVDRVKRAALRFVHALLPSSAPQPATPETLSPAAPASANAALADTALDPRGDKEATMQNRIDRLDFLVQLANTQGWALTRILTGSRTGWYRLDIDGLITEVATIERVSKTLNEFLWVTKAAA